MCKSMCIWLAVSLAAAPVPQLELAQFGLVYAIVELPLVGQVFELVQCGVHVS